MASTAAYPPSVILANSSKPIQPSDAQQLLANYLTRAESNPHLHPDALLQPSGPTFSVQGGPQGGLVLDQLRRVEAGLRGEILKPDPKLKEKEKQGDDSHLDALIAESQAQLEGEVDKASLNNHGLKRGADEMEGEEPGVLVDGEADPEELARQLMDSHDEVNVAKGAETGEVGDRSNVIEDGGEIPTVKSVSKTQAEKDAKKAAKKARKQQEKKERAAQRQQANVMGQDEINGDSRAKASPVKDSQDADGEGGKKTKKKKARSDGDE